MRTYLLLVLMACSLASSAQSVGKCGHGYIYNQIAALYPELPETVALKTTADEPVTIPVVFHIVLTQAQINSMGGETNIRRYIDSQVVKTTRDFNAANADAVKIPAAFKPLMGNPHISFALAHTAPDGKPTEGYDLRVTTKSGFNFTVNSYGSRQAFSDAKYYASGGLDAWDPYTYLNIWIISALDNSSSSDVLGLCIPPSFAQRQAFPKVETGVVLSYTLWKKTMAQFRGRTLTHELGHFFELRHIWGDDEGKCPSTGGYDDGIEDTPPQSLETYGCPKFPKVDACSKDYGVMFMNYMDYTEDSCQQMFTQGQVALMRRQVQPYGLSFGLTQHPEIFKQPAGDNANHYDIYPNPGGGHVNIRFDQVSTGLKAIRITNIMGQVMAKLNVDVQKGFYHIDISYAGAGMYFVYLEFEGKEIVERLMIADRN